jgi:hypothetical protein
VGHAQPVLDQSLDLNGREQYRIANLYDAPDFVKRADAAERIGDPEIPPHLCADPRHRRYRMHTKAATWLSAAFFYDKRDQLPPKEAAAVEGRLQEAADFWGIRPQVDALAIKVAAARKDNLSTLQDEDFAWSRDGERHLPLRNAVEVKAAAAYLLEHRDRFEFRDRQDMAQRILQKAARYGAGLGEYDGFLEKTAGFGGCAATQAASLVRDRARLARVSHPDVAAELEKMAATILANPQQARRPDALAKVAEVVDQLDRMLHVEHSEAVPRPEDVLFAITRKTASAFADQHLATTSGSVYDQDELGRLRTRTVREYLGDDLAGATTSDGIHVDATKLAEILPTLPMGDARIFDQMCKDVGVRTFAKEAGAPHRGFSREDLLVLATAHRPA